jgi:hypothetical protein
MNDAEILKYAVANIKIEEIQNEKKIHIARVSVFLLVFLMMSLARVTIGPELNFRFVLIASFAACCIILSQLLWYNYNKIQYSSTVKYLLVTLDIAFAAILVSIVRLTMSRDIYEITTDIPAFLVFFLINALSGLRFDLKLSIYCAVASIIVLIGFTAYDSMFYMMTHPYLIMFASFKGIILISIALLSGYIARSAKRVIIQNYKEQEEKNFVKKIFGKYVTQEVRDQILNGLIPLNGEKKDATVLFADLRDFTPYVEENDPECSEPFASIMDWCFSTWVTKSKPRLVFLYRAMTMRTRQFWRHLKWKKISKN